MPKTLQVGMENREDVLRVASALDNPSRLRILDALNTQSLSISELAERTGLPQSTVTMHIKVLEGQG